MAKSLPNFNLEEYESKIRDVAAISSTAGKRKIYTHPANYASASRVKPGQFVNILSNIFKAHVGKGGRYG